MYIWYEQRNMANHFSASLLVFYEVCVYLCLTFLTNPSIFWRFALYGIKSFESVYCAAAL